MRIYLIGFMASGKSTLGGRVAGRLEVPFLDTDSLVAAQAGLPVAEIFNVYGEDYFRECERDVLQQTTLYPKALIATGGGLPLYARNMDWLLANGITIYLQWPDELLLSHAMQQAAERPLLARLREKDRKSDIRALLESRKATYERAAITLELAGNVEEDADRLDQACRYIW